MENLPAAGLLVAGFVLLIGGAETMVRHASRLGLHYGLRPVIIGTTIVAFGTSAPEFVVSFIAAIQGKAALAVGNAVGSNVANIGLVLGLAAVISPIPIARGLVAVEYLSALLASLLAVGLAWDGNIDRTDGLVLCAAFALFFVLYFWRALTRRRGKIEEAATGPVPARLARPWLSWAFTLVGVGILLFGAGWVVEGASAIALNFGMSQTAVSATIVALGTSLPEVAASAVAALKREHELAVGNVLGSNIFNMLFVLGPAAVFDDLVITADLAWAHMAAMIAITLLLLPLMLTGRSLGRAAGSLLLLLYVLFFLFNAGLEFGWFAFPGFLHLR